MLTTNSHRACLAAIACVGVVGSAGAAASVDPTARAATDQPLAQAGPLDAETRALGRQVVDRAIEFLRTQQDDETGGWLAERGDRQLPAFTGLVLTGMLLDPRYDQTDPAIDRGLEHLLSFRRDDGGIHDGVLPSYNTAIAVSTLSLVRSADAGDAVDRGVGFLRGLQYSNRPGPIPDERGFQEPVPESHPFFGGVGYGRHGRPDLSNLSVFLQAMHDAGVSSDDRSFQDALVFLRRVQMDDRVNEMPYAEGSRQGGFVYATVPDAESVDGTPGQSQAGEFTEVLSSGVPARRLRAYGSMTYAGFKSLIYADLPPDDPRVVAALVWIDANYTLDENPGMGDQGYYYGLAALARALGASGRTVVNTPTGEVDWRADLIRTLAEAQDERGAFRVRHPRWMEDRDVLITAYGLIALQHALR